MAYTTKTVTVTDDWTFITSKIAILQFNDEMEVVINESGTPTDNKGIRVGPNESYTNPRDGLYVWVKDNHGGTNNKSVRVVENE